MATLTIDLDDQATDGLEQLNAVLEQSAIAAEEAGKGADQLTESQQRQIVVINKTVAGWSELANTSIRAFGMMGAASINAFDKIENGAQKLLEKYGLISKGTALAETTAALGAQATGWNNVGSAATTAGTMALKTWLQVGPQVLGATVALKSYEAILARTGLTTIELADGTTKLESNMDRVNVAIDKFGSDIKTNFSESAAAFTELTNISLEFPDIWASIDEMATKSAGHLVENIGLLNDLYSEALARSQDYVGQALGAEAGATRALIEENRKRLATERELAIQAEKQKEGLAMLGRANDELAGRQQYRAEQARIASLDTIQAIETERKAVQAAADEQVKAGKFVAADKEAYYQKMDVLQVKQMALEKDQANKRAEFHKAEKERFIDEEKMLADRYQQVYDIEIKRRKLKSEQQTALVDTGKKEDFNTQMDVVKDTHAGEKEVAEARLKAQGATELQIKQQLTEMDRKFSADLHAVRMQNIVDESRSRVAEIQKERQEIERAGGDALERDKRLTKLKGDEDKLLFDLRKKGIEETGRFDREQNKLTNDLKIAGIQAQLKAEEERINKTKAMADAVAQKFDAKQFGQQQDPQKVFEQFQRDRMLKAQQEQVARDQDLWTKGQNVGMPGQKAAQDKFWSNQKAAMQKAKNQAARDAENGNFSDGELQKAQVNVGKEVVNNAGKQGQINANTVKALNDVLTGLANTADAQDNVQATLDRLVAAAKGQKQVAKRQAENARNQANSLE